MCAPITSEKAYQTIIDAGIPFPLVVKPNEGINGKEVIICHTKDDWDVKIVDSGYFDIIEDGTRIIQTYADYDQEYGIMYVRLP